MIPFERATARGWSLELHARGLKLLCITLAAGLLSVTAHAQIKQPPGSPDGLHPAEVYRQATRPLEQVRSSLDNWSPAELAALGAGAVIAKDYCLRVTTAGLAPEDVYDLARVCALGLQWNEADKAASAYIQSSTPAHRVRAYAIQMNANLNLKNLAQAKEIAATLLRTLPFDAEVDEAVDYLIRYLTTSMDDAATQLARDRQPALLAAMEKGAALKAVDGDGVVSVSSLFDQGLELVWMERYAGDAGGATRELGALRSAVAHAAAVSPDDQMEIDRATRQYELLGKRLPEMRFSYSLSGLNAKPRINPNYGSATILLLFPEWCAQCRDMMQHSIAFAFRNSEPSVHVYGIVSLQQDPPPTDPSKDERFKDLWNTPTLATSVDTLQAFGANAYPFAVITDDEGRIRFLGAVPSNAFDEGGYVEQMISRTVTQATQSDARRTGPAPPH